MNPAHLDVCNSEEWAAVVRDEIIPWVLDGLDIGDDVIEVGPGPGRTTDVLHLLVERLTAVELDEQLAASLASRFAGTNVTVVHADATDLHDVDLDPAGSAGPSFSAWPSFSAGLCFSMLHHVPTPELQDRLLAEMARVVRPGGVLAGEDSLASDDLRDFHVDDTYVPLDPATLPDRLVAAGWRDVEVVTNEYATRFRGVAP